MAIMFPELSKTTVHIGIGDGQWCEVPMLTLAQFNEFQQIQFDLAKLGEQNISNEAKISAIIKASKQLAALACSVMPRELHDRVKMMGYSALSALVECLCTGKDNSEEDAPEKKVLFQSQMKAT